MEKFYGTLRHVVSTLGGALVGAGYMDASDTEMLLGALIALVGAGASVWDKIKSNVQK